MSKLKSYLGLSVKSGSVVIGQDRLKKNKSKLYALILSQNATDNLTDLAIRLAEKFDCELIQTNELLENLIHISGCKFVGITNQSLAEAILKQNTEWKNLRRENGK